MSANRVLVLLNVKAGTVTASAETDHAGQIRNRFARHQIDAETREVPGTELAAVTREARDSKRYDLIIAAGGDGTLNTVAGELLHSEVAFGVLPLGTFNHLAKELAIPLTMDDAVDALATGRDVPFNVGEVNGRVFLLFAAIGIYSDMIKHRDAQRRVSGRRKMVAGVIAFFKMLIRWPLMRVTLSDLDPPGPSVTRLTTVAYASLSGFQMEQMGIVETSASARDSLTLLISPHVNRLGLVWVIVKALVHRAHVGRDMERIRCERVTLQPHGRPNVRVGIDGEVFTLQSPLKLRVIKSALKMRVPV